MSLTFADYRAVAHSISALCAHARNTQTPLTLTFYKQIRDEEGNVIQNCSCTTLPDNEEVFGNYTLTSVELDIDSPPMLQINDVGLKFKSGGRTHYCELQEIRSMTYRSEVYDTSLYVIYKSLTGASIKDTVDTINKWLNVPCNTVVPDKFN